MSKIEVLYDEHCYLCQQSKNIFKFLDWFQMIKWQSLQRFDQEISIDKEELHKEIHVINSKQVVRRGYEAMTYLFLRTPITFFLGLIMSIPGTNKVGDPIYRWIANHRYRLFEKRCRNGSCSIS
ncbi:thiol-disulfide oxidoreductase DCC family protein [Halobacillus seohaensis]|uniref:Thiol-disulfide oxidoreductase DCC family protein n=1 Tax=Halobacillus seohaensis TaxID=447421 RepID=A0ABW2ENY5_9BACI